jgi:hypothetical protein
VRNAIVSSMARAAVLSLGLLPVATPTHAADEAELKAAIVFNVLVFVEWPDDRKTLELCVAADNALLPALRQLDGREIRTRTFKVQELTAESSPIGCKAAFIDAADRSKRPAIVKALSEQNVFLISDDADAPAKTTAVTMQRVGPRIALDVSLPAVRQARVQVSSKLLRLARTVRE